MSGRGRTGLHETGDAFVTPPRPVSRDATPREEDREAGD